VFGLGPWELAIILVIVVILFGVGKLPELGTGLGEGIKNFKKSYRDAKALDVTPDGVSQNSSSAEKEEATSKSKE
jgi:sec-independent protein translocase protein TatA